MSDGTKVVLLVGGPADGQRVQAAYGNQRIRIAEQPRMQWLSYKESTPTHLPIYPHEYHVEVFCGVSIGIHESLYGTKDPYAAIVALLVQNYPPNVIRY